MNTSGYTLDLDGFESLKNQMTQRPGSQSTVRLLSWPKLGAEVDWFCFSVPAVNRVGSGPSLESPGGYQYPRTRHEVDSSVSTRSGIQTLQILGKGGRTRGLVITSEVTKWALITEFSSRRKGFGWSSLSSSNQLFLTQRLHGNACRL